MTFSYSDFSSAKIPYPRYFHTLWSVDKNRFMTMESMQKKELSVSSVLASLGQRTTKKYFHKLNLAQIKAISYSEYVFPTYKFILPDAFYDDWLSTLDPHKEHCRDHTLHQPLTAYIVAKMLGYGIPAKAFPLPSSDLLSWCGDTLLNSSKTQYLRSYFYSLYPDYQKIPKAICQKLACDVFYEAAVVSALFHDIGYPWQYVCRLNKSILAADFHSPQTEKDISSSLLKNISERLLIFPFFGYSSVSKNRPLSRWKQVLDAVLAKSERETHGFPGALAFTKLQDDIRPYPQDLSFNDAIFRFIYDWAAVGIMMHDMPKIYFGKGEKPEFPFLRLSFESDPLSALVSLADVLEEFERPCAKFTPSASGSVELEFEYPCSATEAKLNNDVLDITYYYKTTSSLAINMRHRINEIDDYFNGMESFVDLRPLGINEVRCHCT